MLFVGFYNLQEPKTGNYKLVDKKQTNKQNLVGGKKKSDPINQVKQKKIW